METDPARAMRDAARRSQRLDRSTALQHWLAFAVGLAATLQFLVSP